MSDTSFAEVRSVAQVLERTPQGRDVAELLKRLGLWTEAQHVQKHERKAFPTQLSVLTSAQLSDEQSYWTSEMGRITELLGIIAGQKLLLENRSKKERSAARARVRRRAEEGTKLTAGQITDESEEDPAVQELDEKLAFVLTLMAYLGAVKEATVQYLNTLSREITRRGDELKARIY